LATPAKYADPVTKTSVLSNGLSVSTETIPGMSTSTVGLWIDAGSRADAPGASGTAHFLEVSEGRTRWSGSEVVWIGGGIEMLGWYGERGRPGETADRAPMIGSSYPSESLLAYLRHA
jgi:hypothetical protein